LCPVVREYRLFLALAAGNSIQTQACKKAVDRRNAIRERSPTQKGKLPKIRDIPKIPGEAGWIFLSYYDPKMEGFTGPPLYN
jgi:hypothetical protein